MISSLGKWTETLLYCYGWAYLSDSANIIYEWQLAAVYITWWSSLKVTCQLKAIKIKAILL